LVKELSPEGTFAGELEVFGAKSALSELIPGPGDDGNEAFVLSESLLLTRRVLDYEESVAYPVRVRTTMPLGFFKDTVLPVRVEDVTIPYVELMPLTGINTLQGRVVYEGGGEVDRVGFEISSSPFFSAGSLTEVKARLNGDGVFSSVVKNLELGRTYYYRAHAVNVEGTGKSVIGRFTAKQEKKISGIWKGSKPVSDSGWLDSSFGLVYPTSVGDWVYHRSLGWIYVQGDSRQDVWIWIQGKGWHWTASKHYPYLYRNELSGWVYLLKDELGNPVYYNTITGDFERKKE
ncbi:MAG: hypothetical protein VW879_13150, partial [Opitutae bacterium]